MLFEYDRVWPQHFAQEAAAVREALGDRALAIEHVGSTSVPGLAAKPIIDMVLVVENTADEAAYVTALESAGYVLHIRETACRPTRLIHLPDAQGGVRLHELQTFFRTRLQSLWYLLALSHMLYRFL